MEERRHRKRAQNRLNQRARRQRLRPKRAENNDSSPFTVHRWRLDDDEMIRSASSPLQLEKTKNQTPDETPSQPRCLVAYIEQHVGTGDPCIATAYRRLQMTIALSSDHLLHLVHFNAFRGLVLNKSVIARRAAYFVPTSDPGASLLPYVEEVYPGNAVLVPNLAGTTISNHTATALDPTQLQASVPHSVWINLLPFPAWRDNLIRWADSFDHAELVEDIIGKLIDLKHFPRPDTMTTEPPISCGMCLSSNDTDEPTTSRNGLILWGEPHIAENWEFTPGFLRKWGWTLQGCEYTIDSTNRWRIGRGEEPLQVTPCP